MIGTIFQANYWLNSVGPNVMAVVPCGILTFAWSRTRFWPLAAMKRVEDHLVELRASHDELHRKLDDLAK